MIRETTKNKVDRTPLDIKSFKDDDLAPKGRTKHIVETEWPVKEVKNLPSTKRKKIKRTETARLP